MDLADTAEITLIESEQDRPQMRALATTTPADLLRIAVEGNADLDKLERLMALQERYEASQARKAYDAAFAAFKAEAVKIIKNKQVTDGPLKGKSYADLFAVTDAVTPALSLHGLSTSWKVTKDDRDWLEITCYVRHVAGHCETVSMGGPLDTSGAKNALQGRGSTKNYLERYTLLAALGLTAGGEDNDGAHGASGGDWVAQALAADTMEAVEKVKKAGTEAFTKARDVAGFAAFMRAVGERSKAIKGAKA